MRSSVNDGLTLVIWMVTLTQVRAFPKERGDSNYLLMRLELGVPFRNYFTWGCELLVYRFKRQHQEDGLKKSLRQGRSIRGDFDDYWRPLSLDKVWTQYHFLASLGEGIGTPLPERRRWGILTSVEKAKMKWTYCLYSLLEFSENDSEASEAKGFRNMMVWFWDCQEGNQ